MLRIAGCLVTLGLSILLCSGPSRAAAYISGKVTMQEGGGPVGGAAVEIYALAAGENEAEPTADPVATSVSMPAGAFTLRAPAPGRFLLRVDAPGFSIAEQELDVPAAGIPSVSIEMVKMPRLRLKVLSPDGKPIAGQPIQAWWSVAWINKDFDMPPINVKTTDDGVFEIVAPRKLPAGILREITVTVRAPGVGCGEKSMGQWPADTVPFPLITGGRISGEVTDRDGKPVPHASVIAVRMLGGGWIPTQAGRATCSTEDDGRYDLANMPFGIYVVRIMMPDRSIRSRTVEIKAPDPQSSHPASGG